MFEKESNETLESEREYILDLYTRLLNGSLQIVDIPDDNFQKVLSNLLNTYNFTYDIITKISEYIKKGLDIKDSGYYISNADIDEKNKTYGKIYTESQEVEKILNDDSLIDKVFDEIMIKFKESFLNLTKYMAEKKSEYFTLDDDVLKESLFTEEAKNNIDSKINEFTKEILSKFEREIIYKQKAEKVIEEFLSENLTIINEIIELVHGYYVGVQLSIQDFSDAAREKTKEDENKGLLISISGEPGSGKTSFCKKLARILGAVNPVSIGLDSFDVSNKQVSAVQQISGQWWVGSPNRGHYEYGPLVSVALHNEYPIWIQDEADKSPIELLNVLWNIGDSASFKVAGKEKKCKGTIVLMPLNTSLLDNPNISQNKMLKDSIDRRIHEFYFRNPDRESYKIALIRMLRKLTPEINKKYGTKFKYTDKSLEFLVEKCVKDNIAMGSIENCKLLVLSVVDSMFRKSEGKKPSSLVLSYDEAASSLFCKKNFDENNKKDEKAKKEK